MLTGAREGPSKAENTQIPTEALMTYYQKTWVLLQPCEVQGTWHCNKDASALTPSFSHTIQETKHALRTLLGGVWAKEKTSRIVTLLVQDNWNRGAFAEDVLSPKWKHIWFFFKGGSWLAEYLSANSELRMVSQRKANLGTRPDAPALYGDK